MTGLPAALPRRFLLVRRRHLLLTAGAWSVTTAVRGEDLAGHEAGGARGGILVPAGASIQAAVDRAPEGAVFLLGSGTHRLQAVRPKARQSFLGQAGTILNGSQRLTRFTREGSFWVADGQGQVGVRHGQCRSGTPTCNLPEAVFVDNTLLLQVLEPRDLGPGTFYVDRERSRLYLLVDPRGRVVEAGGATFAFDGSAPDVLIAGVIVEKYASSAQKGAIQAQYGSGWTIRNCEVRLNSGGGIAAGAGTCVDGCDVHHNGQIGITGSGDGVVIENSRIWANNTRGFDYTWEAGGAKVAVGNGVTFRGNHVYDNDGPGLWCDIKCRNVLYEGNIVERNADSGLFHEISFSAIMRGNILRHNGTGDRPWFWGSDIMIAASEDVQVYRNTLVVSAGRCGIMLIDQNRRMKPAGMYKTRNDRIHDNVLTFEGRGCAGGASDAAPGSENFSIIEDGGNVFDGNLYRVPQASGPFRFAWGHRSFDWDEIRRQGIESHGRLERY
jgi:hypothetical protein